MVARQKVVVQPTKGGEGWDVVTPYGTVHHNTKQPAIDQAREAARSIPAPSQLIIKGQDGRIQTEHTYQGDPEKYKG